MNYGETLAYWYLRLNGFFPLSNFVLHRAEESVEYSADADLLAIRFPHTYEVIGGRETDWDIERFQGWGFELQRDTIGLIAEVKTVRDTTKLREGVQRAFAEDRLLYAIHRLGMWGREQAEAITQHLLDEPLYRDPEGHSVVGKLLVSDQPPGQDQIPPCFVLLLREADEFIKRRMDDYIDPKTAGRMHFPSDLVQYIIWRRSRGLLQGHIRGG
jgi:hypothetical protein